MKSTNQGKPLSTHQPTARHEMIQIEQGRRVRRWFLNWEIYPIMLLAAILRFYRVDTTEFLHDQVLMYRMAYDAAHQGLLPVTNSTASLGFANPPGLIYLYMIPAAFTDNPLSAILLTNILTTASVGMTYIFTARYFGRVAATIATLLYATASLPLYYARTLWQPNVMPLFVVLFMFALFWGVIERRKGWLFPALLLLGMLYQMHGTTLLLLGLLILAVVFAPETIRRSDIIYALIGLSMLFFPFFLWYGVTNFHDLQIILAESGQTGTVNDDVLRLYHLLLSPYDYDNPPLRQSYLWPLIPYVSSLYYMIFSLALAGFVLVEVIAFSLWVKQLRAWKQTSSMLKGGRRRLWACLVPTPVGAGLLLLCTWQLLPFIALMKHSVPLFPHYLLFILPGPFILIGYLFAKLGACVRSSRSIRKVILRVGLYGTIALIILAQLVGTVASLRDSIHGNFNGRTHQGYYVDLHSLQTLLQDAQQLSQKRHVKRIFMSADANTAEMMDYFSEHMRVPVTVFTSERCLLLPSLNEGPVILVMMPLPYSHLATALLHEGKATLLEQSPNLGGSPFSIYELQPSDIQTSSQPAFAQEIQPSQNVQAQDLNGGPTPWIISRWTLLHSQMPANNTTYNYHFVATPANVKTQVAESTCTFTALHAGDQILVAFDLPNQTIAPPTSVAIAAQSYTQIPYNPMYGPFHLETHAHITSTQINLQTLNGKDQVILPVK